MSRRFLSVVLAVIGLSLTTGLCLAAPADDLQKARDMYAAGDFDKALKQLGSIGAADPAVSDEALKLTAYCYREKSSFDRAMSTLQKLVSVHPDSAAVTEEVKDNITGLGYLVSHDPDNAIPSCRSMAAKYPEDAVMWRYLASDLLWAKGSQAESLVELLKAWDQPAPRLHRAWEARANMRMNAVSYADFDKVAADAKAVLAGTPEDTVLWKYVLGYAYLCGGKFSEATSTLDVAAQMLPATSKYGATQGRVWRSVKYALGCAYEKGEQYDKALACYKEVAAKHPGFWRAQYGVFVCLAKQDELAQASAYISKTCNEQPAIKDKLRQLTTAYMLSEVE